MSLNNPSGLSRIRPNVKDGLGYFDQIETLLRDIFNNFGNGVLTLDPYEVANLPEPAGYIYGIVFCTDETGGAVPLFSDGTNWRRVTDRAIASS